MQLLPRGVGRANLVWNPCTHNCWPSENCTSQIKVYYLTFFLYYLNSMHNLLKPWLYLNTVPKWTKPQYLPKQITSSEYPGNQTLILSKYFTRQHVTEKQQYQTFKNYSENKNVKTTTSLKKLPIAEPNKEWNFTWGWPRNFRLPSPASP